MNAKNLSPKDSSPLDTLKKNKLSFGKTKKESRKNKKQSQKELFKKWFLDPKSRSVVYGVTDRTDDPWWLQLNDFFVDQGTVTLKEKSLFFNSLRLLVDSGVGFIRSLEMLGKRSRNIRLSRICATMMHDMERNGKSFSQAMEQYPSVFERADVKMIYSGELTGKIETALSSISSQIQRSIQLEIKVKNALMYPLTVMGAIFLAGIVMMVFIIPKFMSLFSQFEEDKLPFMTSVLINISSFFQNFWWLLVSFLIGGFFMFQSWKKSPDGQLTWDGLLLRLPIIKGLVGNIQTVRIATNLATLIISGIPLNQALRVLANLMKNSVIESEIFVIEQKVRKGKMLSESFGESAFIDPVLSEILEVGEKSGHVDNVLSKLGQQYEMEVDSQLKNLTTLIEPMVIIFVGGAVVFMALAIMLPIFQLQDLFSQNV